MPGETEQGKTEQDNTKRAIEMAQAIVSHRDAAVSAGRVYEAAAALGAALDKVNLLTEEDWALARAHLTPSERGHAEIDTRNRIVSLNDLRGQVEALGRQTAVRLHDIEREAVHILQLSAQLGEGGK